MANNLSNISLNMVEVFNPILIRPKNLFVEITTTCNYRCKHCHLWRTSETDDILTTDEKIKIIEEFFELNNDGEVILSGGETMYKEEEFFKLSSKCRDLGLSCSANTNSSFINEGNFSRILNEGPNYLVVSLDSHIRGIHDTLRGVKGSYEHVVSTIKQLLQIKRTIFKQSDVMIRTNTVIFDKNIEHLYDYIKFAEGLGIEGITFQILNPTFMNYSRTDHFFSNHFFKEKEQAKKYLHEIISLLDSHKIILTSKRDFEWMCLYIDNPEFISQQVCASHEKNIMVTSYGEVLLCFSMKQITNGKSLGNVREHSLQEFWTGTKASNARVIMDECRKNCGMLNCHRKSN